MVTTAAVVVTGGAATPLAIGAYAALGAATRAGTYYAFAGDSAGAQELLRQGAVGAVEGGTAVIPVGKGASLVTGAAKSGASTVVKETGAAATKTVVKETGASATKTVAKETGAAATRSGAKTITEESGTAAARSGARSAAQETGSSAARSTVKHAAMQGAKEGALGGTAGGIADSATRSETWRNGVWNGLSTVAQRAAIEGTVGALTGGLVGGGLTKGAEVLGPRPLSIVRNPELAGNTTHVRYDEGGVRIEAGPTATDADIAAHLETARILQRYDGPLGQLRQLQGRVKQAITGTPGHGTQGFESRLEVKKLRAILGELQTAQAKLDDGIRGVTGKARPATAAERASLEREISNVETQLRDHAARVDSLAPGRGVVAKEGLPDVEAQPHELGQKLEEFVAALGADGGHVARGGTLRLTAPAVQGKNLAPERSIELVLDPGDLYVRKLRVGDREVPIRVGKDGVVEERYPSGPRTILRPDEIDSVIRNLHAHVKAGGADVSVTHPPKGLEKLPDLIAMVAEGSRFPAIREQIRALELGSRKGNDDFVDHALHEADVEWPHLDVDPERTLPVHFIKNWEDRFREGKATFGREGWARPS